MTVLLFCFCPSPVLGGCVPEPTREAVSVRQDGNEGLILQVEDAPDFDRTIKILGMHGAQCPSATFQSAGASAILDLPWSAAQALSTECSTVWQDNDSDYVTLTFLIRIEDRPLEPQCQPVNMRNLSIDLLPPILITTMCIMYQMPKRATVLPFLNTPFVSTDHTCVFPCLFKQGGISVYAVVTPPGNLLKEGEKIEITLVLDGGVGEVRAEITAVTFTPYDEDSTLNQDKDTWILLTDHRQDIVSDQGATAVGAELNEDRDKLEMTPARSFGVTSPHYVVVMSVTFLFGEAAKGGRRSDVTGTMEHQVAFIDGEYNRVLKFQVTLKMMAGQLKERIGEFIRISALTLGVSTGSILIHSIGDTPEDGSRRAKEDELVQVEATTWEAPRAGVLEAPDSLLSRFNSLADTTGFPASTAFRFQLSSDSDLLEPSSPRTPPATSIPTNPPSERPAPAAEPSTATDKDAAASLSAPASATANSTWVKMAAAALGVIGVIAVALVAVVVGMSRARSASLSAEPGNMTLSRRSMTKGPPPMSESGPGPAAHNQAVWQAPHGDWYGQPPAADLLSPSAAVVQA